MKSGLTGRGAADARRRVRRARPLGVFPFAAGTSGGVLMREADRAGGLVIAGTARFSPA